ncbi:hypothetical protein [Lunatibacter salilacus]|uniref:hypothetical protein n=1 Tax=Lunatibacter salilacus TaxID=2483804 RepID=UPI00131DEE44|nr:hypothetical protein [Lunatibacter salilacus]
MDSFQKALFIYRNKELFEEIHEAKKAFIGMLENISNIIVLDDLKEVHPNHKGTKISKGNELEHCPYQVLDIIRDFDPETGLNIRLLHWWGKGMFLFVLISKSFFDGKQLENFLKDRSLDGFFISIASSPFSYKQIVGDYEFNKIPSADSVPNNSLLGRFQLVKKVPFGVDFTETEEILFSELKRILSALRKIKGE